MIPSLWWTSCWAGYLSWSKRMPQLVGRTALVLTADHGGLGFYHDDILDPNIFTVPFMVWGPGVAADVDLYQLSRLTRQDPDRTQPPYTATRPPIRNGDAANLSLGIAGTSSRRGLLDQRPPGPPGELSWFGRLGRQQLGRRSSPATARAGMMRATGRATATADTAWMIGDAVRFPADALPQTIYTNESPAVQSVQHSGRLHVSRNAATGRLRQSRSGGRCTDVAGGPDQPARH